MISGEHKRLWFACAILSIMKVNIITNSIILLYIYTVHQTVI